MARVTCFLWWPAIASATAVSACELRMTTASRCVVSAWGACFARSFPIVRTRLLIVLSNGSPVGDHWVVSAARCPNSACTLRQARLGGAAGARDAADAAGAVTFVTGVLSDVVPPHPVRTSPAAVSITAAVLVLLQPMVPPLAAQLEPSVRGGALRKPCRTQIVIDRRLLAPADHR